MKIVMFYHSVISDWNHGNAHFLRGIATELYRRGHEVVLLEPAGGWSLTNLIQEQGNEVIQEFEKHFPRILPHFYDAKNPQVDHDLLGADLVIVHEWNEPNLVELLGKKKKEFGYRLFFHDTHHRAVTDPAAMEKFDLTHYDGVLAYGDVIRDMYLEKRWARKAWTWHEAADDSIFYPRQPPYKEGDLVWIGNWGDDERADMIDEFLIKPVTDMKLSATVYGVRYPANALEKLRKAGIRYGGYLPSVKVPEVFAKYRFTVHIPRKPYIRELPGIPTIRPFEAMACGIPLISAPWGKAETIFSPGNDFILCENGEEMKKMIRPVLFSKPLRAQLIQNGLTTISSGHLCSHRIDQLFRILNWLEAADPIGELNVSP